MKQSEFCSKSLEDRAALQISMEISAVCCEYRWNTMKKLVTQCPSGHRIQMDGYERDQKKAWGQISYIVDSRKQKCVMCSAGKVVEGASCLTECRSCPKGRISFAGHGHCQSCPDGASNDGGSGSCATCARGYITNHGSSCCTYQQQTFCGSCGSDSVCLRCESGKYKTSSTECSACPGNQFTNVNTIDCDTCSQSGTGVNQYNSGCRWCIAGERSFIGVCQPCPAGHSSENKASQCVMCTPGKFNPIQGGLCVNCVAGKTSIASFTDCQFCNKETYSNEATSFTCTNCGAGSYAPLPGASSCIVCNSNEIYDKIECRPPRQMQIYKGLQGFEIEGNDYIKIGPTTEISVSRTNSRSDSIMYYRSGYNTQDPCTCMNDRDFAHLCGHSIVMNQDAYLTTESEHQLLSSFAYNVDTIDDDRQGVMSFKIERRGVCKSCLKCNTGHFNPNCPTNIYQEGSCLRCKTLALDCSPGQYMSHAHPLGCEFDSAGTDYVCMDCQTYMKNSLGYFLLVGCGATDFVRWSHTHYLASSASSLVAETCTFETGSPACTWGGVTLERKTPFGSHSIEIPYCPPGYFFSCKGGDIPSTSDPYSVDCCSKCRDCDVASGLKRGASYSNCTGYTDTDTQYTQCQVRCENNMYENAEGNCVGCTTCREGEI